MDFIVSMLVSLFIKASKHAHVLPGIEKRQWESGMPIKILLVGYNGARNTGADARVHALIGQIKNRFGAAVEIDVLTLDQKSTSRMFTGARQIEFSKLFFWPLLKACSSSDVVLLCEGSTLKSTFANALSLFFCQAAGISAVQNKPCIAYGSEIGNLDPVLETSVRKHCGEVLFIARSQGSLRHCEELGLTSLLGTDTAWNFNAENYKSEADALLHAQGWDGKQPLIGVAPINPFWWPVTPSVSKLIATRLGIGHAREYSAGFYHSWDEHRAAQFERYLDAFAATINTVCEEQNAQPVIFGMERLDKEACDLLAHRLERPALQVLAVDHDALTISCALQHITFLFTSRYHAQVLAMKKPVPTVSVTMDERLAYIDADMGLNEKLIMRVDDDNLQSDLLEAWRYVRENALECCTLMSSYRSKCLTVLEDMLDVLDETISKTYPHWKEALNAK